MDGSAAIVASAMATARLGEGRTPQSPEEAARELSVTFLTTLIREMRKTVPENELLPRSPEKDVYDGAFDRSVAEAISARDPLGLVRALRPAAFKSEGQNADNGGGVTGPRSHP